MKIGDLVQYDVSHDSPFIGAVIKVATPKMVLIYWFSGCWEDRTVWCRGYDFDNLKKLSNKILTGTIPQVKLLENRR